MCIKFAKNCVPPKRGVKRAASSDSTESNNAKIKRKNQEFLVKPDSRNTKIGGIVLSCGQGDVGQLGLGEDVMEKSRPATIPELADVVSIAAGGMHSVCLTQSGKVITFGCNDEGALGRDTSKEGSETVPGFVDIDGTVIQITAGDSHSAALLETGHVLVWGSFRDSHGTMGLINQGNEKLPVELFTDKPDLKIVKISSGTDHLVMLSDSGLIYTCGCGEQGQLGRVPARKADRHSSRNGLSSLLIPGLVEFKVSRKLLCNDIWAGQYCTFAREHSKGQIYAFGLNNYHQIGLKKPEPHFFPTISPTFNDKQWNHISSGQHHTIVLDNDGKVYAIGRKEYGRLGLGSDCSDAIELTHVATLEDKIIDISAGSAQSFAVTESGQLYAWGMGSSGQLGTGGEEDADVPVLIKSKQFEGKAVMRVAGGGQHTLILAAPRPAKEKNAG